MWPILKKEIREHLVLAVAVLAFNSFMFGMFAMAHPTSDDSSFRRVAHDLMGWACGGPPLLNRDMLNYLLMGGHIYAGALGLLQTLSESVRGTYPFLAHLPVTRLRLFLGKVAAGVVLYLVPMLLPFLALVWWAGTHTSPFSIDTSCPGLLFISFSYLLYLAGMLVGLSPARWYTTRPAGIVVAVMAVAFVCQAPLPTAGVLSLSSALVLLWAGASTIERRSF